MFEILNYEIEVRHVQNNKLWCYKCIIIIIIIIIRAAEMTAPVV
jgi:t-SNARE complex subunit (syntaxin)